MSPSPDSHSAAPAPSSSETSRRRLIALLGAGSAGALATLLAQDEARAGHDSTNVFHLGQTNIPPGPTVLSGGELRVHGPFNVLAGPGPGASITSGGGHALRVLTGDPNDSDSALIASTPGGTAIEGIAPAIGVQGVSGDEGANYGTGPGTGVQGISGTGIAVHALATSTDGLGLAVDGRSAFSTVGSAVIPAGAESVFVSDPAVTATSHITVTLTSDPGQRQVRWVQRNAGAGFTVHLSSAAKKLRPETALTYMIVEPR